MSGDDSSPWGDWTEFVCEEGISAEEQKRRESVVADWMASPPSIDAVIREGWAFEHGLESFEADQVREEVRVNIAMYERQGIGLYLWRAYLEYRHHGLPVGEEVLKHLDALADRQLSETDDRKSTLANLPLDGKRKPGGKKHMESLEGRRRIVQRVWHELQVWPKDPKERVYSRVAEGMQHVRPGLTGDYVKKIWCDWLRDEEVHRNRSTPDPSVKALGEAMNKWR